MSLAVRKIVVLGLIGMVFLTANILVVANWISDTGIADKAGWIRREFLTGTAIPVSLIQFATTKMLAVRKITPIRIMRPPMICIPLRRSPSR